MGMKLRWVEVDLKHQEKVKTLFNHEQPVHYQTGELIDKVQLPVPKTKLVYTVPEGRLLLGAINPHSWPTGQGETELEYVLNCNEIVFLVRILTFL